MSATPSSNLARVLADGHFGVTAEVGPPRGSDPAAIRRKAALLKGYADAYNVTDNQTAVVRMCSLAGAKILLDEGLEPVMQMTVRDRNRIALQSDLLGACALGLRNCLCISGDHQKAGAGGKLKGHPGIRTYLIVLPVVLVASAISYHFCKLYVPRREGRFFSEVAAVIRGSILSVLVLTALSYVIRVEPELSRYVIALFFVLNCALLSLERGAARSVLRKARRRGWNLRHVIIVGAGKLGQMLLERIKRNPWTGFKVIGFIDDNPERQGKDLRRVPVLGGTNDLRDALQENEVDQVFIALPFAEQQKLKDILDSISDEMVDIRIVPDLFSFVTLNPQVGDFDGLPILSLRESPLHGWHRVIKRLFDITFSLFAMIFRVTIRSV